MKPSTDLSWHPRIQRWWWRIRGKYRLYQRSLFPKLTQEQREAVKWDELEREKDRSCRLEARRLIKAVNLAMLRIGNAYPNGILYNQVVRWSGFGRDDYFTKIFLILDVRRVPGYILVSKLNRDPCWTDDLASLIGLPVSWSVGDFGAILTIQRPAAAAAVRRVITVEDLLNE